MAKIGTGGQDGVIGVARLASEAGAHHNEAITGSMAERRRTSHRTAW